MDMVAGRIWVDERRPIRHVDWVLLLITGALVVVGLLLLYSATASTLRGMGVEPFARVKKQGVTAVLGFVLLMAIATFDYRFFKVYAGFIYVGSLAALVLVKVPGLGATDATGTAQRWFEIAGFQITPSEVTKLALIVMLAAVLSELRSPEPTVSDLIRILGLAAVPLVLVFIQPDIGTSIVIVGDHRRHARGRRRPREAPRAAVDRRSRAHLRGLQPRRGEGLSAGAPHRVPRPHERA